MRKYNVQGWRHLASQEPPANVGGPDKNLIVFAANVAKAEEAFRRYFHLDKPSGKRVGDQFIPGPEYVWRIQVLTVDDGGPDEDLESPPAAAAPTAPEAPGGEVEKPKPKRKAGGGNSP